MPRTAALTLLALALLPAAAHAQCQLQKFVPEPVYSGFGIYTHLSPNYGAVVSDSEGDSPLTTVALYRRAGNTLTFSGHLLPAEGRDPGANRYGHGLAMSGTTIVTADYMANDFQGRVYTFLDNGATFDQQTTLIPPPGVSAFGSALATDGQRLVVTSTWTAPNGGPGGNAWVYTRNPTGWTRIQSDLNSSGLDGPEFGWSVSMDADTLAIGAPNQFDPGMYGSAFVYTWNGAGYTEQAQVFPPADPFPPQGFGQAVVVSGDLLFVGAPERPFTGQVFIYKRTAGVWSFVEAINPTSIGNEFGRRIAYLPESSLLLVSAEGDHTQEASGGAVYPFTISPAGNATALAPIFPNDMTEGHRFGAGLSASNGLALIGARGNLRGSAYVFLPTGTCPETCPGNQCGGQDYNGDGDFGTDQDIEAFFACLGGTCCPNCFCQGSDFNGDGDFGTDQDIESFFRVLGGGSC